MVVKHSITIHDTHWPFSAESLPYLSEPLPYIDLLFTHYSKRNSYHSCRNLYHTLDYSLPVILSGTFTIHRLRLSQLAEPLPYIPEPLP